MTMIKMGEAKNGQQVLSGWLPRNLVALGLLGTLIAGCFAMVLTNQDPLIYGPRFLPGMKLYDAFAFSLIVVMSLIPMLLARRILATPEAQTTLLVVLAVSGLYYTIPTLWEVRMSPQLHRQFYGFFQHDFLQQARAGGFRAMVFVSHGLTLSIFLSIATLSAVAMTRIADPKHRLKWIVAAVWLFVVLILNKSLGALAITIFLLPLVAFLRPRSQLLIAASFATIIVTYPLVRAADMFPTESLLSAVENIDPQRAQSLNVRFENEDILLEKTRERPVFGWGGWNRNRVFNSAGRDMSVTDGEWVIQIGVGGWVRYVSYFGLLCWPIIALFFAKRDRIDPICALLTLILCAKLIDLIPNSGTYAYIWLISGSLLGRLEFNLKQRTPPTQNPALSDNSSQSYRRQRPADDFEELAQADQVSGRPSYSRTRLSKD